MTITMMLIMNSLTIIHLLTSSQLMLLVRIMPRILLTCMSLDNRNISMIFRLPSMKASSLQFYHRNLMPRNGSLPVDLRSTSGRLTVISGLDPWKIVSIDYSAALALDGVIGSVDANDIQGTNEMMQMWQKEHCDRAFATDKVTSTGQIIAGIVGTSKRIAQKAASLGIFQKCIMI